LRRLSVAVAALVLSVLLASPALVSAQEDPASLLQQLQQAVNAKDADAAVALFADDAVIDEPGEEPGTRTTHSGPDGVREWVEGETSGEGANSQVALSDITGEGDMATASFEVTTGDPQLAEAGLDPIPGTVELTAKDGKIARFVINIDEAWMQKAEEAMAAMEAESPTAAGPGEAETPAMTEGDQGEAMGNAGAEGGTGPGKLPASGADSTNWLLVTLVGMLGVAGLGTGLWMRHRAA
jgi:ketosteroid isomerase-like protein